MFCMELAVIKHVSYSLLCMSRAFPRDCMNIGRVSSPSSISRFWPSCTRHSTSSCSQWSDNEPGDSWSTDTAREFL